MNTNDTDNNSSTQLLKKLSTLQEHGIPSLQFILDNYEELENEAKFFRAL